MTIVDTREDDGWCWLRTGGAAALGMLIGAARVIAGTHADVWIGFAPDDATRVTVQTE